MYTRTHAKIAGYRKWPLLCTRICPYPLFEATPPGAAPGTPVKTGARVRRFRGCKNPRVGVCPEVSEQCFSCPRSPTLLLDALGEFLNAGAGHEGVFDAPVDDVDAVLHRGDEPLRVTW